MPTMDGKALAWIALGSGLTLSALLIQRSIVSLLSTPKKGGSTLHASSGHHRLKKAHGSWSSSPVDAPQLSSSSRRTRVFRIVLTGGPLGGKASLIAKLVADLNKIGYDAYTVPECPTVAMNGGCRFPGDGAVWQLTEFECALLGFQLQAERAFTRIAASTGRPSVVIMDRGLMDIKAFVPAEQWRSMLQQSKLSEAYLLGRYDCVVHMTTVANGEEKVYRRRAGVHLESPAEARALDQRLREAWKAHPRQAVICNFQGDDFEDKLSRAAAFVFSQVERGTALPHGSSSCDAVPPKAMATNIRKDSVLSEDDHANYNWIFPHQRALAKFGHEPKESSELRFNAGEVVIVLGEGKGEWVEWLWGRNSKGEVGMFPENLVEYLHLIDAEEYEDEIVF